MKQPGLTQDISLNVEGLIISLSEGVQSIAMSMSVCLSAPINADTILPNFAKSLCMLVVVVARSSVVAMRTSGLWMTSRFFHIMGPMARHVCAYFNPMRRNSRISTASILAGQTLLNNSDRPLIVSCAPE